MGIADWLLIATAFGGTLLIIWTGRLSGGIQLGHLLAAGSGLCYGLDITMIRKARAANNSLTPFFYISAVGTLACLGPFLWQTATAPIGLEGAAGMLAIGILAACALLATNKALGMLTAPNVGVISMLELPLASLGALMLFGETVGLRQLFGAALIVVSAIGLNFRSDAPDLTRSPVSAD